MGDMNRNDYETAVALAQQGRHAEALAAVERYLQTHPQDIEALNDAGAICHCIGKTKQAIKYLSSAMQLDPSNAQVILNMLEVYIAAGMLDELQELLECSQNLKLLNPGLLNRVSDLFIQKGEIAAAVEVLLTSLKLWPNQDILRHILTVLKSKRPKLAFFCGADGPTFLNPILGHLKERFDIQVFDGKSSQQLHELMQWSDISWFEWCTDLAAVGTAARKSCKTIVRLHRYEAYSDWPQKINWHNVDVLVTVGNTAVKNHLVSKIPQIANLTSIVTVPNGVDVDNISFVDRPRGKNIAFVGNIRSVKNFPLILQCMQKLHYIDNRYRLFVAGIFADAVLEQYIKHMVSVLALEDVIIFDGWQNDVNSWLGDKHYIVSSSLIESQGMGILEGMAAGLKPVIHNFCGAEEIYPKQYLFNIAEEFCQQILSDDYTPLQYRQFVQQRYSSSRQLKDINGLLKELEKEIAAEKLKSNVTNPVAVSQS